MEIKTDEDIILAIDCLDIFSRGLEKFKGEESPEDTPMESMFKKMMDVFIDRVKVALTKFLESLGEEEVPVSLREFLYAKMGTNGGRESIKAALDVFKKELENFSPGEIKSDTPCIC